jgi:hypothetical protein
VGFSRRARDAKMIEQHYGTLIDAAHDAVLTRFEGFGTP